MFVLGYPIDSEQILFWVGSFSSSRALRLAGRFLAQIALTMEELDSTAAAQWTDPGPTEHKMPRVLEAKRHPKIWIPVYGIFIYSFFL